MSSSRFFRRNHAPIAVFAIFALVVALYWSTLAPVFAPQWQADADWSGPFVLIGFISSVWGLRERLALLPCRPGWLGLIGIAAASLAWLCGEWMLIRFLTQVAAILLVGCTVWTLCGPQWARALRFPLLFLLLAVPLGGPLIPWLVEGTASFSYAALRLTAIPVHRDGAYLIVPSGSWSIADACSGIAYFRLCLVLGALYAWTIFRTTRRQLLFFAAIVVLAVVGNWLRAYLTIAIAHATDNAWLRDSHGAFGWWLYAFLLTIVFWVAWRFRQAAAAVPLPAGPTARAPARSWTLAAVVASTSIAGSGPFINMMLPAPPGLGAATVKVEPAAGWRQVEAPQTGWQPHLVNPGSTTVLCFEKAGHRVDVFLGFYWRQDWDAKLVSSVNQLADPESRRWTRVDHGRADTRWAGLPLTVATGTVLGEGQRIDAWHWYWLDGRATASGPQAKWLQLRARLAGAGGEGAWIAIAVRGDAASPARPELLSEFMQEMSAALDLALSRALAGSARHRSSR